MAKIAYVCDRQDPHCKDHCGYPVCAHTTDINHAVNFTKVSNKDNDIYFEIGSIDLEEHARKTR